MFTDACKQIAYMVKQLNYSRVTITKYIEYINSIYATCYSFYHMVLVKFICDVVTRSRLQLIDTSIDTFFSKLNAFLVEQRKEGRPVMVQRKQDAAVDESSVDQEICKSDVIVHNL